MQKFSKFPPLSVRYQLGFTAFNTKREKLKSAFKIGFIPVSLSKISLRAEKPGVVAATLLKIS